MEYREYVVPPALAPFVAAFWTLEDRASARRASVRPGADAPEPEPVIPDGHAELIVHFGDPFERFDDDSPTLQADILVAGQLDAPLLLRPTGAVATLGVRMTPVGGWAFLGIPQSALVGTTYPARELSRPLHALLSDARDLAGTSERAVPLIADGLLAMARPETVDVRVAMAVRQLDRSDAPESIAALGAELELTPRHLQRLFRAQVGLSPRTFGRIRRFQRALALIEDRRDVGASAIAHRAGYADQSHFIREFRALAGTTPSAHALARAELTGVFVDGAGRRKGTDLLA